jgi:hypothetical protein
MILAFWGYMESSVSLFLYALRTVRIGINQFEMAYPGGGVPAIAYIVYY